MKSDENSFNFFRLGTENLASSHANEKRISPLDDCIASTSTGLSPSIPQSPFPVMTLNANEQSNAFITPWEISPPPKIKIKATNRGRKSKATILTSSPYKVELETSLQNIQQKRLPKLKLMTPKTGKQLKAPRKKTKKNIDKKKEKGAPSPSHEEHESSSGSEKSIRFQDSDEDEEQFEDAPPSHDAICNYCNKQWKDDETTNLKWTSCLQCDMIWAHENCIPQKSAIFFCSSCSEVFP